MKSEFVALEMAGSEVEWLKNFLVNILLGMKLTPFVSIHCDCQSVIAIAKTKLTMERIDIYNWDIIW